MRPLASRYWVLVEPPELVRVVAVPIIRPAASRVVVCTVPPLCFWRSIFWTIRPDESRTTSRQVWAEMVGTRTRTARKPRTRALIQEGTALSGELFEKFQRTPFTPTGAPVFSVGNGNAEAVARVTPCIVPYTGRNRECVTVHASAWISASRAARSARMVSKSGTAPNNMERMAA